MLKEKKKLYQSATTNILLNFRTKMILRLTKTSSSLFTDTKLSLKILPRKLSKLFSTVENQPTTFPIISDCLYQKETQTNQRIFAINFSNRIINYL